MNETAPLLVVALGGNAISPPAGTLTIAAERPLAREAARELAAVASDGTRLLVVHGNGPQVGRLLAAPGIGSIDNLDVHVAQTQGELGYLIAECLDECIGGCRSVALVTRVLVAADDPAFAEPAKPVGAVLSEPPRGVPAAKTADGSGWRRVVASPRPIAVLEEDAIRRLLADHHVVAGGGGGVALAAPPAPRQPCPAVVDKDWVASLLAVSLRSPRLLYVTDVSGAFDEFGTAGARAIASMTVEEAKRRLAAGVFAPGSMEPKVASAVEFVEASGGVAVIATIGRIAAALAGDAGTTIRA